MINFIKKNIRYLFVLVLLIGMALIWFVVFVEDRAGWLTVAFLDVGQGDAVFIQAENGNQILLDGGANKAVLHQLGKMMPFYDRSIDMVIVSHPDADHIGGLVEVLKRYHVGSVMESGVDSKGVVYKEFKKLIRDKEIQNILARKGMQIKIDEGLFLNILFPVTDVSKMESNQASIVVKLVYGDTSFLLTGDAPKSIEKYLISIYDEGLESNVLKLAHHGSKTSTSEIFLGYVNPEYAIISVGAENRYGHPNQEVLDLLEKFEIKVLRTDESGTIIMKSDGEALSVTQ